MVWKLLADPYAMVGCVPGAAIVSQAEDGSLETTLSVRFGPVGVSFQARAELELDHQQMRGRLTARGKDKLGGARFSASVTFSAVAHESGLSSVVSPTGALEQPTRVGSIVSTTGGVEISGRLASIIEGGASAVVKRMSAEFASCLSARCEAAATG
jgi:uncharacterized protein